MKTIYIVAIAVLLLLAQVGVTYYITSDAYWRGYDAGAKTKLCVIP